MKLPTYMCGYLPGLSLCTTPGDTIDMMVHTDRACGTLGCHGNSGQERGISEAPGQPPSISPAPMVMMGLISLPAAANQGDWPLIIKTYWVESGSPLPSGIRIYPCHPSCLLTQWSLPAFLRYSGQGRGRQPEVMTEETQSHYFNGVIGCASKSSYRCY